MMVKGKLRRVALLLETSRQFGRQLMQGIAAYSHDYGPWTFLLTPGDFRQAVPRMRDWGGEGIIARIADRKIADALAEINLPTVVVGLKDFKSDDGPLPKLVSSIDTATEKLAELAAEHLLENKFTNFAFVGIDGVGFSDRRCTAFCDEIRHAGHDVLVYPTPSSASSRAWENEHRYMADWIDGLPKPIGIMACNDDRGREVLEACSLAGIKVPEDVSVVGVDNDSLICDLATPPLSSVEFGAEAGGYLAAQELDKMMSGQSKGGDTINIAPSHVHYRRSTSVLAVEDRDVAAALYQIRRNRGRGVTVASILDSTALPRRTLEVRFRKETGRSIREEIGQARLTYAKELLAATLHPIAYVAELSGYKSTSYLSQVFRKHLNCTPAEYRKRLRRSDTVGERTAGAMRSTWDGPQASQDNGRQWSPDRPAGKAGIQNDNY
ncbi:MAG: DNA-binding transcriptional regulator [Planctomycetota bacterium]